MKRGAAKKAAVARYRKRAAAMAAAVTEPRKAGGRYRNNFTKINR